MDGWLIFRAKVSYCVVLALVILGCGTNYEKSLPDSAELGSPRGLKIVRTITHYHSAFSHDACDKKGLTGGKAVGDCTNHLRDAICTNRVNFLFLTDHPSNMANYEFPDLLLQQPADRLLMDVDGNIYGNQLTNCPNGFMPVILPGFESRLLALGMIKHLSGTSTERLNRYAQESPELRSDLDTVSSALVMIPHTESRSVSLIESLQPDGIEIYNIHANLDPKIRKRDLGMSPFEVLPKVLSYLVDPYNQLNADFMFMQFLYVHPIYFQKWDQLIADGHKVTGVGGTDSHENVFPQKASDGERLDSHRRLTRFMSNHVLVARPTASAVKDSLKRGRSWLVFEGLGSPVNFDFYATAGDSTVGVGESAQLAADNTSVLVKVPRLHSSSPQGIERPSIRIELKKVTAAGQDQTVATARDSDLSFRATEAGAYRAEVWITPKHLRPYLGPNASLADVEYRWIITNHLYLTP